MLENVGHQRDNRDRTHNLTLLQQFLDKDGCRLHIMANTVHGVALDGAAKVPWLALQWHRNGGCCKQLH